MEFTAVLSPTFCLGQSDVLTAPGTTSLGLAPPTMGWALVYQSLVKKMCCRFAYRKRFLNQESFSSK